MGGLGGDYDKQAINFKKAQTRAISIYERNSPILNPQDDQKRMLQTHFSTTFNSSLKRNDEIRERNMLRRKQGNMEVMKHAVMVQQTQNDSTREERDKDRQYMSFLQEQSKQMEQTAKLNRDSVFKTYR